MLNKAPDFDHTQVETTLASMGTEKPFFLKPAIGERTFALALEGFRV